MRGVGGLGRYPRIYFGYIVYRDGEEGEFRFFSKSEILYSFEGIPSGEFSLEFLETDCWKMMGIWGGYEDREGNGGEKGMGDGGRSEGKGLEGGFEDAGLEGRQLRWASKGLEGDYARWGGEEGRVTEG